MFMRTLFKDIYTLLPDNDSVTIRSTSVCVDGNIISAIGDIPPDFSPDTTISGSSKLLIPGLINSHTHVYMSLFRNYADDLHFTQWLFDNILPLEDKLSPSDSYWGTMLGYMEMLRTGTTCLLDMYIHTEQAVRAQRDTGIRAVMSRGLSGDLSEASGGPARLSQALDEIQNWSGSSPTLSFMLAPHAPYTCDPDFLSAILEHARSLHLGINIHVSESRDEINTIKTKYNATPVEFLDNLGILRDSTVANHCVFLSDSDIDILARRNVSVATNPISNMKLANGFAPVTKLLDRGVNVCLGTDSAASNNALNLFRDLSALALIHKGSQEDSKAISASQAFLIATKNGASALGLHNRIGQIKVGMLADLVIIDIDKPWFRPHNNLIAALAYSATGTEVDSVMVDGNFLLKNGAFPHIDSERVFFEVDAICNKLGMRG